MKAVRGASERRWCGAQPVAPGPRLALLYRLHEIAAGLGRSSPPPLLAATPSSRSGHLDPDELVARRLPTRQASDCSPGCATAGWPTPW